MPLLSHITNQGDSRYYMGQLRTNNTLERLNREVKRQTKVVGTFPDGQSALMLVCARLRYVASTDWGTKRYLNMKHLTSMIISDEENVIA